jgi:hypothetical protein
VRILNFGGLAGAGAGDDAGIATGVGVWVVVVFGIGIFLGFLLSTPGVVPGVICAVTNPHIGKVAAFTNYFLSFLALA